MKIRIENEGKVLMQNTFITADNKDISLYSWNGFNYNELSIEEDTIFLTFEQLKVLKEIIDHAFEEHKKLYKQESEEN